MTTTMERPAATWALDEGHEVAAGLTALQLLGGGTRYEAYLAFDDALHHVVVVKVLRPDRVDDDSAISGLRTEADVLSSLNHPAIARMLRDGVERERPHIVLEFVDGPRLSTLIRRFSRLETGQTASLAVEVASALHYLHGLGLVHLDVKPKNLIMGAPPRLIDLSIARSFEDAARLTIPIGTDAYMAPEQSDPARGLVGSAADVWGLGATLYEAVTASPAFPRDSRDQNGRMEERFPQLAHRPAPLPSDVPGELAEAIHAALAFDPAERPTAREIAETVEPLLRRPRRLVLNQLKPR
jgi:eukaryotic-like serine/threonine-protein kinase